MAAARTAAMALPAEDAPILLLRMPAVAHTAEGGSKQSREWQRCDAGQWIACVAAVCLGRHLPSLLNTEEEPDDTEAATPASELNLAEEPAADAMDSASLLCIHAEHGGRPVSQPACGVSSGRLEVLQSGVFPGHAAAL